MNAIIKVTVFCLEEKSSKVKGEHVLIQEDQFNSELHHLKTTLISIQGSCCFSKMLCIFTFSSLEQQKFKLYCASQIRAIPSRCWASTGEREQERQDRLTPRRGSSESLCWAGGCGSDMQVLPQLLGCAPVFPILQVSSHFSVSLKGRFNFSRFFQSLKKDFMS